jgi:hypothetical protein
VAVLSIDVDLSQDLAPKHREVLRALSILSKTFGTEQWCLVGGLMVLVAARASGHRGGRAEGTKDGDVVVDICAAPALLRSVTHKLVSTGYTLPDDDWGRDGVARCTFVSVSGAQIDVLCPDDAPDEALASGQMQSIAIPGGRRALEFAEPTLIYFDDDLADLDVRVPMLLGAIIVKTHAALDQRTAGQPRHIEDVAWMLSIIDPRQLVAGLEDRDSALLGQLQDRFRDDADIAWRLLDDAQRNRARAAMDLALR